MLPLGREAVRVKVLKFDPRLQIDVRKFSVDPQITSLEEMRSIIVTAFELKEDFSLSYRSGEDNDQDDYLALFSNWDLDTAFLRAQNMSCLTGLEPSIHLKVDVKPNSSLTYDLKKNSPGVEKKTPQSPSMHAKTDSDTRQQNELKQMQVGFQGMLLNHMEKTINLVSRAFNLSEDSEAPTRPPLSQSEFLSFLGPVGHVIHGSKLREVIYNAGVEPTFRKVAWKHILNVYPDGMSGKERLDYMKKKSAEYLSLRDVWRDCMHRGQVSTELNFVTNMVKKDVLRTDRQHKFFSGGDDNQNITTLFNILTTYALNHPTVSYCQGMSDLASPLLVVMENEAHAYVCLCALMSRLYPNFLLDGEAMTLKFAHLTESLQVYDPIFYSYLQTHQADDLLFCYRWLLLEMKREFAFEDALHMLEVLWSSLPANPPKVELSLKEKDFSPVLLTDCSKPPPISPLLKTPRENAYAKLCALRRQSSSYNIASNSKSKTSYKRMNQSLDDNISKVTASHQICKEFQSLDESCIITQMEDFNKRFQCKNENSCLPASENDQGSSDEAIERTNTLENKMGNGSLDENHIPKNMSNNVESSTVKKCTNPFLSDLTSSDLTNFIDNNESIINDEQIKANKLDNGDGKNNDPVFVWENPLHENGVDIKNLNLFYDNFDEGSSRQNTTASTNPFRNSTDSADTPECNRRSAETKEKVSSPELPKINSKFFSNMSLELENARKNYENLISNKHAANLHSIANTISNLQKKYDFQSQLANVSGEKMFNFNSSCEEANEQNGSKTVTSHLPPAKVLGGGNPFLIFLSLTLLMQHRDYIIRNQMDYNELAMYFDKMVRKHNVNRVLSQARKMYSSYLKENSSPS